MLPKSIPIPIPGGLTPELPRFLKVTQILDAESVSDVAADVQAKFSRFSHVDLNGKSVAIAVGSRGIPSQYAVVQSLIKSLKQAGAEPFIFPAMGSHGGGTANGQEALLAGYGYTEAAMGIPVRSAMDVVQIGQVPDGPPVYCDALAHAADWIIPVNRVKPHTSFRADHESGMAKMLAIGVAKHAGAEAMHFYGADRFGELIPAAAQIFLDTGKVLFGVGIVENSNKEVRHLDLAAPDAFLESDAALLRMAKDCIPRLLFPQIDILIIDQIGKNISGSGLDPNVTGRPSSGHAGFNTGTRIDRIVIRDLTDETLGNACGLGTADVTTQRLLRKVDWTKTYVNLVTAGLPAGARLPIVANSDHEAIGIALRSCPGVTSTKARIVRIANTLALTDIWVSEPMLQDVLDSPSHTQASDLFELPLDADGAIVGDCT